MSKEHPMDKKTFFQTLLEAGSVYVHLDPRKEGVVVPSALKDGPMLTLVFGLRLPVPIPDLEINQEAVTGTLSFDRTPYWCKVPWKAVYALSTEDGRALVWPEDLPRDVQLHLDDLEGSTEPVPKRRFGVLEGGLSRGGNQKDAEVRSSSKKPTQHRGVRETQEAGRPDLRLVTQEDGGNSES